MKPEFSDVDDIIHIRPKQEILFNVSNFIGIVIFSYYGFLHYQSGQTLAGIISAAYALLGMLALLWVNVGGNIRFAQIMVLGALIPLFCLVMVEGNPRSEGPIWIIIYPLLAFFYTGKKNGLIWVGALICGLLFVLFLEMAGLIRSPFPVAAFLIVIACLLTVAMYVYAYDAIRSDAEQTLKSHTLALDEANRKLVEEVHERQEAQQKVLERTHELSELNEELSDTVEKLARLNAEKNELMNMIAHDLRNPLTGVLLAARQLESEDHLERPDNRRRIAEVKQSIQYTLKLINNFLGLKAIEAGQTSLEVQPHDLGEIVGRVASSYHARAALKHIDIVCHAEPVLARCDPAAAAEVAENLISNALKFSPSGKRIEVAVSRQGDKAQITVRDEGPGISREDQRKLFKMFTRLSAQPTAGEESIGLGLSTAKKLTEMMAGRIWCESEFGSGAAFMVELPAVSEGENV